MNDHDLSAYPVKIRPAEPADADAVSLLLEASYTRSLVASYDSNVLRLALPYLIKSNPALLASDTYYAAETERRLLVGCGGWSAAEPGSGKIVEGEAHIRHVAIHPEWTRRGVGTSLLARCISDARVLGIRKLHCLSTLNAAPFYRTLGFESMGTIDVPMGPTIRLPAVLMECEIR